MHGLDEMMGGTTGGEEGLLLVWRIDVSRPVRQRGFDKPQNHTAVLLQWTLPSTLLEFTSSGSFVSARWDATYEGPGTLLVLITILELCLNYEAGCMDDRYISHSFIRRLHLVKNVGATTAVTWPAKMSWEPQ
jgi:hypothetical protein